MLRFVTIICFFLVVALTCEKKTGNNPSQTTVDTTALAHPLPPCSTTLVISKDNSELIDSACAATYYNNFKERITKQRGKMMHMGKPEKMFCKDKFRYLKYGLFLEGTIDDHLCINEKSMAEFAKRKDHYDAIRLYPCFYKKNEKNEFGFLFVFTEGKNHTYNDSYKTRIILFKLASLKDRVCRLWEPDKNLRALTSHRLCTPNCPNDDDLLADY